MTRTIHEDALAVLSSCTIENVDGKSVVKIGPEHAIGAFGQLDRMLYRRVNAVLEALGGAWNRKIKGHIFDRDPTDALEAVMATGAYVDPKKTFGFFETPVPLAQRLCRIAGVNGARVLEPSAGRGRIVQEAVTQLANEVVCVELQEDNVARLRESRGSLWPANVVTIATKSDFLSCTPKDLGLFEAIPMNPPFQRQQDIDHVRHAHTFLGEGGRLVAIMSAGVTFREDKKTREFRSWLVSKGGSWERLPEGSFLESGTAVSTVLVTIQA